MLKDWQHKFPNSFIQFPNLFSDLNFNEQESLSQVLHLIEQNEEGGLNDELVSLILANSSYLSELTDLVSLLSKFNRLNKSILNDFLSQPGLALTGLNRTLTLFRLSSYSYKEEHFPVFFILTKMFENPLCRTIFDARIRCFSDYGVVSDPLNSGDADEILNQLVHSMDEETRVHKFFDFFVSFRPFPPSQKYIVDVDVADKVTSALTKEMRETLRKKGGNKLIFDTIKYDIASRIESEDLCSSRNYDELMGEIWSVLNQLQVTLKDKGYHGFFAEVAPKDTSYDEQKKTIDALFN